jgi:hypothetical protein
VIPEVLLKKSVRMEVETSKRGETGKETEKSDKPAAKENKDGPNLTKIGPKSQVKSEKKTLPTPVQQQKVCFCKVQSFI